MLEGHNPKYQEYPLNIYTLCLGSLNNNTGPFPVTIQYKIMSINIAGWLCIKFCGFVLETVLLFHHYLLYLTNFIIYAAHACTNQ